MFVNTIRTICQIGNWFILMVDMLTVMQVNQSINSLSIYIDISIRGIHFRVVVYPICYLIALRKQKVVDPISRYNSVSIGDNKVDNAAFILDPIFPVCRSFSCHLSSPRFW